MPPRARPHPNPTLLRAQAVRLRDGRTLVLRPVHPDDAAPIAGAFALLREDDVRRRFLHPVKHLGAEHLERLVRPGPRGFAVVAAEPLPPGEALIGAVARIACEDDGDADGLGRRAEFGILVSHFVANQGLGRRLLARLLQWARANGVREVYGDVLDDNAAMLRLAELAGFRREQRHTMQGLTRVVRKLRPR